MRYDILNSYNFDPISPYNVIPLLELNNPVEFVVIVITYEHIVFMNNMMFAGQGPLVVKKGRHLVLPYEILNFEALPQLEPYSPLYHFPILFQFFTFAFSSFYLVPVS